MVKGRKTLRSMSPISSIGSSISPAPSMDEAPLSDHEIATLPLRRLNHILETLSAQQAKWVKNRRRLLKNRGYAQVTRKQMNHSQDTMSTKKQKYSRDIKLLKSANTQLKSQIQDLQREKKVVADKIEEQKRKLSMI